MIYLAKFMVAQKFATLVVTVRTGPIDKHDRYHGSVEFYGGVVLLSRTSYDLVDLLDQLNQEARKMLDIKG